MKVFLVGLSVRLFGVGLIWLGDGHDSLFRKALVVAGVVLLIGGTAVLRYLLLTDPLTRAWARIKIWVHGKKSREMERKQ
jgi:hypothetical protein